MIKCYSDLRSLPTFEERFEYLSLKGSIGLETFGFDRIFNQQFYKSKEWKQTRQQIILRDSGCDLGIEDRPIHSKILIHHMNPITIEDIREATDYLLNPEFLICTSKLTHDAIHYGDASILQTDYIERSAHDTIPWR